MPRTKQTERKKWGGLDYSQCSYDQLRKYALAGDSMSSFVCVVCVVCVVNVRCVLVSSVGCVLILRCALFR